MKKLPQIINNTPELKEERRNLFIVLAIFDFAFLLRLVLNLTAYPRAYSGQDSQYKFYLVAISPDFFIDVLPLGAVMLLHHLTFRKESRNGSIIVSLDSRVNN